MGHTDQSVDTLVDTSGTLAGIGLALVGILSAKSALDHTQTLADDFFLFSSIGFLVVLTACYASQKENSVTSANTLVTIAEWVFSISLLLLLIGGFILVYTEI